MAHHQTLKPPHLASCSTGSGMSQHLCGLLRRTCNHMAQHTLGSRGFMAITPSPAPSRHHSAFLASAVQPGSNGSKAMATETIRHTYDVKGYGSHPPPALGEYPTWTQEVIPALPKVPVERQIFCNRALNMKQIKAVGFDMDYTLAQYKPDTFEGLAHKETVRKLVDTFQYPTELLNFGFKWDYMTKGLIIDKVRGNVIKADRHNYVKIAYHGFESLTAEHRKRTYNHSQHHSGVVFDDSNYAMVDTLFSLAEAYLFMQLVDLKDQNRHELLSKRSYKDLYRDLRTAVDMCHRDGSLKRAVANRPEQFIHRDQLLKQVLKQVRNSGRKVFLATNSLWDFTNVVMNYLLSGLTGSDKNLDWLQYFDVVVVGCAKPGYFHHRVPLFSVDTETGMLQNTDNGAPIIPIDERDMSDSGPAGSTAPVVASSRMRQGAASTSGAVFQGGNYVDLHKMIGVNTGAEVLYVGDHIYGDIVKSKKDIGWRTMLVVPELQLELEKLERAKAMQSELRELRVLRDEYDDRAARLRWSIEGNDGVVTADEQAHANSVELLSRTQSDRDQLKARHSMLLLQHHRQFHPIWGQLMKTGHQNSRYAHQIERYACLYTSHVSNLVFVSPDKSFMGRMDYMAHEHALD